MGIKRIPDKQPGATYIDVVILPDRQSAHKVCTSCYGVDGHHSESCKHPDRQSEAERLAEIAKRLAATTAPSMSGPRDLAHAYLALQAQVEKSDNDWVEIAAVQVRRAEAAEKREAALRDYIAQTKHGREFLAGCALSDESTDE